VEFDRALGLGNQRKPAELDLVTGRADKNADAHGDAEQTRATSRSPALIENANRDVVPRAISVTPLVPATGLRYLTASSGWRAPRAHLCEDAIRDRMRITFDLACLPPLSCRATLYAAEAGIEQLEALGGRRIERGDPNAVAIQFIEPLELVAAAREVAARVRDASVLRAFAAASHALDLLRDPQEPMRSAWAWICDSLGLELPDGVAAFVAAAGTGYLELAPDGELLERPALALVTTPRTGTVLAPRGTDGAREIFDCDEVFPVEWRADAIAFQRDPLGWSVRELRDVALHVNGNRVDTVHRLATGDRLRSYYYDFEVIAII
jgi:hypothetical protein